MYLQHDTEHHVPGGKQSGAGVHAQGSRSVTMTERERLFKPFSYHCRAVLPLEAKSTHTPTLTDTRAIVGTRQGKEFRRGIRTSSPEDLLCITCNGKYLYFQFTSKPCRKLLFIRSVTVKFLHFILSGHSALQTHT